MVVGGDGIALFGCLSTFAANISILALLRCTSSNVGKGHGCIKLQLFVPGTAVALTAAFNTNVVRTGRFTVYDTCLHQRKRRRPSFFHQLPVIVVAIQDVAIVERPLGTAGRITAGYIYASAIPGAAAELKLRFRYEYFGRINVLQNGFRHIVLSQCALTSLLGGLLFYSSLSPLALAP